MGHCRTLTDDRGLYMLVTPTGGRLWRFRYRIGGVEKLLALGAYPDVPLKRAREKRDEARTLVADGVDPMTERREARAARLDTFELIATEWLELQRKALAPETMQVLGTRLKRFLYPYRQASGECDHCAGMRRVYYLPVSMLGELTSSPKPNGRGARHERSFPLSSPIVVYLYAMNALARSLDPSRSRAWWRGRCRSRLELQQPFALQAEAICSINVGTGHRIFQCPGGRH